MVTSMNLTTSLDGPNRDVKIDSSFSRITRTPRIFSYHTWSRYLFVYPFGKYYFFFWRQCLDNPIWIYRHHHIFSSHLWKMFLPASWSAIFVIMAQEANGECAPIRYTQSYCQIKVKNNFIENITAQAARKSTLRINRQKWFTKDNHNS